MLIPKGNIMTTTTSSAERPLPRKASAVTTAATGVMMHPAYAEAIGRIAYIWGWPLVNMMNRRTAVTEVPHPGRLNGVLPRRDQGKV